MFYKIHLLHPLIYNAPTAKSPGKRLTTKTTNFLQKYIGFC